MNDEAKKLLREADAAWDVEHPEWWFDWHGRVKSLLDHPESVEQTPIGWLTSNGSFIPADEVAAQDMCTRNLRACYLYAPPQAPSEALIADKDAAYLERNRVVAALAKLYPSGTARTAIKAWNPEWHGCVYIDLPTGQVSWHYHDSQSYLFADLPAYAGRWDGHDTTEKYRRLAALTKNQSPELVKAWALIETADHIANEPAWFENSVAIAIIHEIRRLADVALRGSEAK
jgi:hypothetical protein